MLHHPLIATLAALAVVTAAAAAEARGSPHESRTHALSAPPCGWSGGSLADPAETQRCLAERFKDAKQKPAANTATTPPGP